MDTESIPDERLIASESWRFGTIVQCITPVTISPSSVPIALSVPPTASSFCTAIPVARSALRLFSFGGGIPRGHVTNGWGNYAVLVAGTLVIDSARASLSGHCGQRGSSFILIG